jgi:hypothetical protein
MDGSIANATDFHLRLKDAVRDGVRGVVASTPEEAHRLLGLAEPGVLMTRPAWRALDDPALRAQWGPCIFRYGETASHESLQRPFLIRGLKVAGDVVGGSLNRHALKREIEHLLAGLRGLLHTWLEPQAVYHVTLMGLYHLQDLAPKRRAAAVQAWQRYRDTLRELGGAPPADLPESILHTDFTTNDSEADFTLPHGLDTLPGARQAVATGHVSTIPDTMAEESDPDALADLRCLARRRIGSFVAVPLRVGSTLATVVNVTSNLPRVGSDAAGRQRQLLLYLEPLLLTLRILMAAWRQAPSEE